MLKSNEAAQTDPTPDVDRNCKPSKRERAAVWALIALSLILAAVPDFYGWRKSGPDHHYVGFAHNIDDAYVYLAWTKQAEDGHFFARNLFTTSPQLGRQFNLFFLLMGNICRLTHLSLIDAFTLAHLAFGGLLLWAIYRFAVYCLPGSALARIAAFALSALGTGLGWILAARWIGRVSYLPSSPIDSWQPEAFTFLSVLMSSLFCVSTLLILATLFLLLRAESRGSMKDAALAGLCALVLGNIHSYDVLHIGAAWGLFLVVKTIMDRKFDPKSWLRAVVAGLICVPTVAYQYYLFKADPIFHARAEVPTPSYGFWPTYGLGYGLTLLFAALALVFLLRSRAYRSWFRNEQAALLLACWIIGVFAIVYVPNAFQRKMIMGVHIPLCLLAGSAAAFVGQAIHRRTKFSAGFLPLLVVLLSIPSGLIWLAQDIRHINNSNSETQSPTFLTDDDIRVFHWISKNTRPDDAFVGIPWRMMFVPAYCDRRVWCGHWGETPDYGTKVKALNRFSEGRVADPRQFLKDTGANYLVWPYAPGSLPAPPPYLQPVYSNNSYIIYRIL